jgi:tetratricopeptide (TPR) repeat protein
VLREEYRDHPELERRLVEEAQVGGQLQHPGVCPVHELGRFPDGRPYFTMKLVKGRTLGQLLNERPHPGYEQARFLTVFAQVCQAVAYAHSKGVIHRDLKPGNVMVGAFGEVHVMDWGLAKVLDRGGTDPEATTAGTVIRTVRSGSVAEEGGRTGVVGTPAYMAPEQARGEAEAVDERADVFSLGAMLCVLLTGQPPFTGADREEVLRKAAGGAVAEALAWLGGCGADAELVALCRDCLAPLREGRPRGAGEVAARVAAYQGAVQERLRAAELDRATAAAKAREEEAKATAAAERRSRRLALALVAVLGAGIAATSYFLLLARYEAQKAGDLAAKEKAAREIVEAAADQMVTEATEEGRDVPQMDPAWRRLLEKALEFYRFSLMEKPTDPARRQKQARAHRQVGYISQMLGQTAAAKQAYHEAVGLLRKLTDEFPERADYRHDLAVTCNALGQLLRITNQPGAEESYGSAVKLQEQLAREFPRDPPSYRRELARTHNNRGILLKDARRFPEAAQDYARATELLRRLRAEDAGEVTYRVDLAGACTNWGVLRARMGQRGEAEAAFREAIALLEELFRPREALTARDHRYKLAVAYIGLGNLLAKEEGRRQEAKWAQGRAIALLERLVLQFPDYQVYRRDLANSHNSLGYVLEDDGQPAAAEAEYQQALQLFKELTDDFPRVAEYDSLTAMTLNNLAWLTMARAERATAELLFLSLPESGGARGSVGFALAGAGWQLLHQDQHSGACRLLQEAIGRQKAALQRDPGNPAYPDRLADHYRNLARAALYLGDHANAAEAADLLHRLVPERGDDCCHAARFLARCAALAARDGGPARSYAERAVRLLREAAERGHAPGSDLAEDADFAALRARPDFQALLRQLQPAPKQSP